MFNDQWADYLEDLERRLTWHRRLILLTFDVAVAGIIALALLTR